MIPWHEAVTRAMGEPMPSTEPARVRLYRDALQGELVNLWSDLDDARSHAIDGNWSMQCDWLAERIVHLTRLTGPAPWGQVPTTLLLNGVYAGIMDQIGVAYERPDLDEVRRLTGPGGERG